MTIIDIYRGADLFVSIKPDDSSTQLKKVMSDNLLNISFEDSRNIKFSINDYCTVFGERYQLNQVPVVTKGSRYHYKYTLIMQAEGYDLAKVNYLFLGADNTLREAEFSLMGNADTFIDLILSNANRAGSGWLKGQVIAPSPYKNLTFSKVNCYNALSRLAEEFETEFWIIGKTIHLTKKSNDTGNTYKHGQFKGLYEITRQILNNSSVVTRLYAFGAEKNLPPDYNNGARRLQMRADIATPVDEPKLVHGVTCDVTDNLDGTETVTFSFTPATEPGTTLVLELRPVGSSGPWITSGGSTTTPRTTFVPLGSYNVRFRTNPDNVVTEQFTLTGDIVTPVLNGTRKQPQYYIEKNVLKYGVIEFTEYFEDVFPHRTGKVSSVDATNPYKFIDTSIDFDVNNQLLPGIAAKVTFNTGQLAGYTFDIGVYDNSIKQFTILKNKDEKVLDVPSDSLKPAINDEYVLTDMLLPQSYIDAAEAELKVQASALLDQISVPQVIYTIVLDPVYLKKMNRTLNIGDLIWITDVELELQKKIRIVSIGRNIVNEFQFQAELADTVSPGTIALIVSAQSSTGRDVTQLQQQLLNNSILNNNVIGDLTIQQGTEILKDIPTTSDVTGFSQIYIEDSTGKLYKKV